MKTESRQSRRNWILGVVSAAACAGTMTIAGCGSGEATFKPMESPKRDDVDKSINNPIDNPYGVDIKNQPKVKKKAGAGRTTRD